MNDTLRSVQVDNEVPDFGDARIRYGWIDNDQLMYVDDLPVYALAGSQREPLSDRELYQAYLQSLVQIIEQTELIRQELQEINTAPQSRASSPKEKP